MIDLIAWKLGGRALYEHAREGTVLTANEADTFRFAFGLFLLPPVAGYAVGQAVDLLAHLVGDRVDRLPPLKDQTGPKEAVRLRARRRALASLNQRLLNEGPTTWDRRWRRLRRNEPFAYARVTTSGGRQIIGLVANASRVALSPQPHDLYLEQVLQRAPDGNYYPTAYGLGAFVAGTEIESVEWVSHEGIVNVNEHHG